MQGIPSSFRILGLGSFLQILISGSAATGFPALLDDIACNEFSLLALSCGSGAHGSLVSENAVDRFRIKP
jgi:hypothetical protein